MLSIASTAPTSSATPVVQLPIGPGSIVGYGHREHWFTKRVRHDAVTAVANPAPATHASVADAIEAAKTLAATTAYRGRGTASAIVAEGDTVRRLALDWSLTFTSDKSILRMQGFHPSDPRIVALVDGVGGVLTPLPFND